MASQKLTDATAKRAQTKPKDYELSDDGGACIGKVKASGTKCGCYAKSYPPSCASYTATTNAAAC